jgi:aspartate racemase
MKTIGLIGGMSWQSTAHYYDALNKQTASRLGGLHSASILMHSLDFAPIAQMQSNDAWEEAGILLAQSAANLEEAGADFIALATNTMHIVAPAIEQAISVPFIHIADATADELLEDGMQRVGLLGTRFTMDMPFYKGRLVAKGLDVLTPQVDVTNLNAIIFEELCRGIVTDTSKDTYLRAIDRLKAEGAEAVILGCTEISMLIDDSSSALPVYDTTELHANALVELALSDHGDG